MALMGLLGCIMVSVVESAAAHDVSDIATTNNHEITDTQHSQYDGRASSVWKTFQNKHISPICNNYEFKFNFGIKDSLEECLETVKATKHGNVGIWQRGLDQNCYVCDLHGRGKASSLSFIESEHIDAFVKFSGEVEIYSNSGNEFMKTPGQWRVECFDLPDNTKYITTQYDSQSVIDYFKPIIGESFCTMMRSNQDHLWWDSKAASHGPDDPNSGDFWIQPSYATGDQEFCGGSAGASDGNSGEIGTWCTMYTGKGDPTGGHINGTWGHAFKMTYMLEYETCEPANGTGPSTVGNPLCECGNTHCNRSNGEACNADTSACEVPGPDALTPRRRRQPAGGNTTGNTTGNNGGVPSPSPAPTPAPSPTPAAVTTTTVDITTTTIQSNEANKDGAGGKKLAKESRACPPAGLFSSLSVCVLMWLAM